MSNIDINRNVINISRTASMNTQAAQSVRPSTQLDQLGKKAQAIQQGQGQNVDFKSLLEQRINTKNQVVFSKHAQQRVEARQIDVSEGTLSKLNDAIGRAKEKGVKDALILNGDSMFIVNTISNIVVTALKGNETKDNVFTNIDGTVII